MTAEQIIAEGAWTLNRPMLLPGINEDGEVEGSWEHGAAYLMVAVFCADCGYTHLFNGASLIKQTDTLDPAPPLDGEAAGVM